MAKFETKVECISDSL